MSTFDEIKNECDNVFLPKDHAGFSEGNQNNLLCVVPNLDLNGAQVVLDELLDTIKTEIKDYNVFIMSPEDGQYRDYYTNKGYTVCIKQYVRAGALFRIALQQYFSAVILNTALVHYYALYFINTNVSVFWWIHESEDSVRTQCPDMPNPYMLSENIKIYGVTSKVKEAFSNIFRFEIPTLHMAIADKKDEYPRVNGNDKTIFVLPAAYTYLKGQDILLDAILSLPAGFRDKAEFLFCGYQVDGQEEYYNEILRISEKIDCVKHLGKLSKDQMYKLYADSDCVIAPSRIDSTPTTIVEAMMFEKLTIASDKCGISKFITDCVNGFVFSTVDELVKRLLLVISDKDALGKIAKAGREIWSREFSAEYVADILRNSGCF